MAPTLNYRDPGTGDFVALGGDALPIGTIMGFGGSVAPTGWHLCDGTAHGSAELEALFGSPNAPDLRDKFIICASATRPSKTTGGAASVTLTSAQSGRSVHTHASANTGNNDLGHTHSITFPANAGPHNHSSATSTTGYTTNAMRSTVLQEVNSVDYPIISADASGNWAASKAETTSGAHTHTGTTGAHSRTHTHLATVANSAAANATTSHENRPPYYAMVFIVKGA